MLMTTTEPVTDKAGVIMLGGRRIVYDPKALNVSVEPLSDRLDPLLQRVWGRQMYRLVLTIQSTEKHQTIKYQIR